MGQVTEELVRAAYQALATGQRERIAEYWAEDMRWLVPGHNQMSGWKNNLDEFIAFMQRVGQLSANSFNMEILQITTAADASCDINHNTGNRAEDPNRRLDIDVVHYLRWRDGKVIEGRGAIFGDGTAQFDTFWG